MVLSEAWLSIFVFSPLVPLTYRPNSYDMGAMARAQ